MTNRTWLSLVRSTAQHHRAIIATAILLAVLDALLLVVAPWPLGILADDVLGSATPPTWFANLSTILNLSSPRGQVVLVAILMLLVIAARQGISALTLSVNTRMTRRLSHDLGFRVLNRVLLRSAKADGPSTVGDDVSRILNDAKVAQLMIVGVAIPAGGAVLSVGLMVTVMLSLQPSMTIVALCVSIPLLLSLRVHINRMTSARYDIARSDGEVWATAERTLSAIDEIQAFSAEPGQLRRFGLAADRRVESEMRTKSAEIGFSLTNATITALGLGVLLAAGGLLVAAGQMTVGELLIFHAYVLSLFGPLNSLAFLGSSYASAAASGRRLLEVFESSEVVEDPALPVVLRGGVQGRVEFDGVWFDYGDEPVLQGVSLSVGVGETVALVGVTGSGKSTLVSLVPRLMDVDSGAVRLDGVDVRELSLEVVRGAVAVVRQEPLLLPLSVAENIAFARAGASMEEVRAAAKAANALEFIEHLPQGFDTVLGERGDTLSGGQKQRLAIARALLKDAPVLVLDEPTSALDAGTELSVIEALERVSQDRTVIIVSHRESALVHADRVVQLADGHLTDITGAESAAEAPLTGYAATGPVPIGHSEATL